MNFLLAQARFPKPEFEKYVEPPMDVEAFLNDPTMWRVGLLIMMLGLAAYCLYRWRSRMALVGVAVVNFILFGFIFTVCPCPVGMYQNVTAHIAQDYAIDLTILLLFCIPLIVALFRGRLFCMGGCPLGALQELFHFKTWQVPFALDRILRYIAVIILGVTVTIAASGGDFWLCQYDPYVGIFRLGMPLTALGIALLFLIIGFFISRPFCRYLCPYGVLLRIASAMSSLKVEVTQKECIQCKLCEQGCPNGAILPPTPSQQLEDYDKGVKRMQWLITFSPIIVALGIAVGYYCAPVFESSYAEIRILEIVENQTPSHELDAFESSGRSLEQLKQDVLNIQRMNQRGMGIAGGFLALFILIETILLSRRPVESRTYTVDQGLCVCCGRCYESCPLERKLPSQKG